MRWLCPLFVGEKMKKEAVEAAVAVRRLEKSRFDSCELLVLSSHANCSLEILDVRSLRKPPQSDRPLRIVGLASDREEAKQLLQSIAETVTEKTGAPLLGAYFEGLPETVWTDKGEVSVSKH